MFYIVFTMLFSFFLSVNQTFAFIREITLIAVYLIENSSSEKVFMFYFCLFVVVFEYFFNFFLSIFCCSFCCFAFIQDFLSLIIKLSVICYL